MSFASRSKCAYNFIKRKHEFESKSHEIDNGENAQALDDQDVETRGRERVDERREGRGDERQTLRAFSQDLSSNPS